MVFEVAYDDDRTVCESSQAKPKNIQSNLKRMLERKYFVFAKFKDNNCLVTMKLPKIPAFIASAIRFEIAFSDFAVTELILQFCRNGVFRSWIKFEYWDTMHEL